MATKKLSYSYKKYANTNTINDPMRVIIIPISIKTKFRLFDIRMPEVIARAEATKATIPADKKAVCMPRQLNPADRNTCPLKIK